MERDETVLYFGQNIATSENDPFLQAFGPDRVRVTFTHFAELNLWGFYELANIFGPIEVCLNRAAYDPGFSGANIPAGYHALSAAQALSFVRQRENLPNGDLDRTHRQQAVLDYVIWKVKHQNLVADLVEGNALLNDLKTFMITSGGWNIVEFATEMQNLTGRNLTGRMRPRRSGTTGTSSNCSKNCGWPALACRCCSGSCCPFRSPRSSSR